VTTAAACEPALAREVLPGEAEPPGGGPVTEAFGVLGVTGEPGQDAWASFGLYRFSHMEQWLEIPGLIGRLPQLELVWGSPRSSGQGSTSAPTIRPGPAATRSG